MLARGVRKCYFLECVWTYITTSLKQVNIIMGWHIWNGSSVHGILQAGILEWVAISFSRESSRCRDRTWVSCIAGRCFTIWATREAHLKSRVTTNQKHKVGSQEPKRTQAIIQKKTSKPQKENPKEKEKNKEYKIKILVNKI